MYYELTDDLKTGDPVIDREHRELLQAANRLESACPFRLGSAAIEDAIRFLSDYVQTHIPHEEAFMRRCGYPKAAAHTAAHAALCRPVLHFTAQLPPGGPTLADLEILNECLDILLRHVFSEDRRLADFAKNSPHFTP